MDSARPLILSARISNETVRTGERVCRSAKRTTGILYPNRSIQCEANRRMIRFIALCSLILLGLPAPSRAQVDQTRASDYFKEVEALCRQEGGRMWGVSLVGPMVIFDAASGTIATSRPAPDAPRPKALGYANAAMMWGDTRWTTLVWFTIPTDSHDRNRLMIHELFHRIQYDLKLMGEDGDNSHLDTLEGRYWQQLEWRALSAALIAKSNGRSAAIRDALAFRAARHAAAPGSQEQERRLLINEGLAQYTGTVIASSGRASAVADAVRQLAEVTKSPTFVRTFPYPSAAAYGLLLDDASPGWPRRIKVTDDPGLMLAAAMHLTLASDLSAAEARYDAAALKAAETALERERQAHLADLRHRFVEGPIVDLPAGNNATFVTAGLTPIPNAGVVYQQYRASGDWGSLVAKEVLVSTDRTRLKLPGPFTTDNSTLSGDGWTITLNPGWSAQPGPRPGDFVVAAAR